MTLLNVAPIVEGDGEVSAVPILLRRIAAEFIPGSAIHVLRPIRQPRTRLLQNTGEWLARSIELARLKLQEVAQTDARELVMLLIDADEECAASTGPRTVSLVRELRSDVDFSCVLAVLEYETWFAAAAKSLDKYLDVAPDQIPVDPERQGCRKRWIADRLRLRSYSPTVDQPKLTSAMDIRECRRRSPSFDKLCRDVEARLLDADSVRRA